MSKLRLILLVLIFPMLAGLPPKAQDDLVMREGDERAITLQERQQALSSLQQAAEQFRSSRDWSKAAVLMNRIGRLQLRISEPEQALATYKEASSLHEATSRPTTYIDSLNGISAAEDQLRKCDQAQPRLQQAITLSEQHNYIPGKAEALLTLSDCQNSSDNALALKTAQQSLELWRSVNNKMGMARAHVAIGHYQLSESNLMESAQSHEAALSLWQELNIPPAQAEALVYLAFVEYRKGAWQNSISFLTQARSLIDDKSEPFLMGQISSGLGEAFIESGSPEIGIGKLQEASQYFQASKSPVAVVVMAWDIGRTHYLLGQHQEALEQLERALTDAQGLKEWPAVARCQEYLGRTHFAMGEQPRALSYLQMAFDMYLKVGHQMEAARTQAIMGEVYEAQGKVDRAREYYEKSLSTFDRLSDRLNQSAALYALGRLELRENNLSKAEDYLNRSIEATENIKRVSTSGDLAAAFSATVHERYESLIECLMRQHQQQPNQSFQVHAFEVSELARARSLTQMLRDTQSNFVPGVDPELAGREKLLRQLLRVKEDKKVTLLEKAYTGEQLAALNAELEQLENEYKLVNEKIRRRYPAYEGINRPTNWSLAQIKNEIVTDDHTVLIEYSLGRARSYVWAVTRDRIKSYELPSEKVISEAVQKVYELLSHAGDAESEDNLASAIRELSQLVLSPVSENLGMQRLIVAADGALNYIPFQVLSAPSDGQPLVASHEIINVPSASILGQLRLEREQRQKPTTVLAAFGDPVFVSNYAQNVQSIGATRGEYIAAVQSSETDKWQRALRNIEPTGDQIDPSTIQPLFYSKLELANLSEVAGPKSFVATGFDATREKLEQADLTKYSILHFATHGILDPQHPENSGLFLSMVDRNGRAQDGFIGLQDVYRLRAPVDLVVLSACRTGLGKNVRGEGLIGLTRGFMYAGASSVMASLWRVDDEATAELMKRFYSNMLQRGMKPAAALREAQNSIRQEPQWRSPYFWAAFTLQGEYNRVLTPPSGNWPARPVLIMIAISLFLLFAAGVWWYRRRARPAESGVATPR